MWPSSIGGALGSVRFWTGDHTTMTESGHHQTACAIKTQIWPEEVFFSESLAWSHSDIWAVIFVSNQTALGPPWWWKLRLRASNAGGVSLIPGKGTRSHVMQPRPEAVT